MMKESELAEIEFSPIDWPCESPTTSPIHCIVKTTNRRKTWGYNSNEVRSFSIKDEMLSATIKAGEHRALAVYHKEKDYFIVQCWLNNVGKRSGTSGRSDQVIQEITSLPRYIYTLSTSNTSDSYIYVGQSRQPYARYNSHRHCAMKYIKTGQGNYWYRWMARNIQSGHELKFNVIDAVLGTFYQAQTLEKIWRYVFLMKGFLPYTREDKIEESWDDLFDQHNAIPLYISTRLRRCPIPAFIAS